MYQYICPNDIQYYSEYKEIIHLDKAALTRGIAYDTIAHENQHLIHFNNDDSETTWLDEGIAVFAEYLCGYEDGCGCTEDVCKVLIGFQVTATRFVFDF